MRLIDIDKLRGCAIIRPMSHEEMSHIRSCSNILIHDEIPTAYNKEHDKKIRNKAIEEFAEAIKATLPIAVHRNCSEIDYGVNHALYGLRSRIDRIAEQIKEENIDG